MKSRNPIARVVRRIRQQVIPDKRHDVRAKEIGYFMCSMSPEFDDEDYFKCNEDEEDMDLLYGSTHGDGENLS